MTNYNQSQFHDQDEEDFELDIFPSDNTKYGWIKRKFAQALVMLFIIAVVWFCIYVEFEKPF